MEVKEHLPNHVTKENKYAKILSRLASDLSSIPESMRLKSLGGYGSALGAQNESNILTQIPLNNLASKILIFTDFNIKIGLKDAYAGMRPTLDDYTNFHIKPVIAQNAGLNVGGGARSMRIGDASGSTINWEDQTRTVYHGTFLDYNLNTLDAGVVDGAIKAGIQIVPVPFYTGNVADVKGIYDLWGGYAWRVKEPSARYLKPDPVVPAKPSTKTNARVSDTSQPGQMNV
jgi:hypothetical protein